MIRWIEIEITISEITGKRFRLESEWHLRAKKCCARNACRSLLWRRRLRLHRHWNQRCTPVLRRPPPPPPPPNPVIYSSHHKTFITFHHFITLKLRLMKQVIWRILFTIILFMCPVWHGIDSNDFIRLVRNSLLDDSFRIKWSVIISRRGKQNLL